MKRFLIFDDKYSEYRYTFIDTQIIHFERPKNFWLSMALSGDSPQENHEIIKLNFNKYLQQLNLNFPHLGKQVEVEDLSRSAQEFFSEFVKLCNRKNNEC